MKWIINKVWGRTINNCFLRIHSMNMATRRNSRNMEGKYNNSTSQKKTDKAIGNNYREIATTCYEYNIGLNVVLLILNESMIS